MSSAIHIDVTAVAQHWELLQQSSRLGPIRNSDDYERCVALLDALIDIVKDDFEHPLASLLDVVGTLIEAYDKQHHEIPDAAAHETLRYLMDEHGLSQSELPEVGSQGVVSELLSGKRSINARQAKALAKRFAVSPAVFL